MNNVLKGIYLVFLGKVIMLCSFPLADANLFQQLTFGQTDIWIRLLSHAVTFVAALVVFCGLLKLYMQNTYFKIAFVLQPISIIISVLFALAAELYQIHIPFGDIRGLLSGLLGYVILFCWLWGMASLVKGNGFLRLSKRFKVFPFVMIIFALLWPIVLVLLSLLSVPDNIALPVSLLLTTVVMQIYELYLIHFARTQLSSEKPKDISGIFGSVDLKNL